MRGKHAAWVTRAHGNGLIRRAGALTYALVGVVALVTALIGFAVAAGTAQAKKPAPKEQVTICHANSSAQQANKPYVVQTPDKSGDVSGHADHTGPVWQPGFKEAHVTWGDIIPPFSYVEDGETKEYPGLNWSADGQAIYNNDCTVPTSVVPVAPAVTSAGCVEGVLVSPAITPAGTPTGVSYSISPADYAAGDTVTVTATAAKGYWFATADVAPPPSWTAVSATGWTIGADLVTAEYSVTLEENPDCEAEPTSVAAAEPTWNDATCEIDASFVVPEVEGVYYTRADDPTHLTAGTHTIATLPTSVTIIAHAEDGFVLADDTSTFAHQFAEPEGCSGVGGEHAVRATEPTFTDSTCEAGEPTGATIEIPEMEHVTYFIDDEAVEAGTHNVEDGSTVTVTAEADEGWTLVGDSEWSHPFADTPECSGVGGVHAVAVGDPTFSDSVCTDGKATGASFTIVAADHVTYRVDGAVRAPGTYPALDGSTVTITAEAGGGWQLSGPSTWTHAFAGTPTCMGVLPVTATKAPLANTGAGPLREELIAVAGLLSAGLVLVLLGRRRRRES